ncbi:sensor histidine kinase [Streptomyces radicis]|uniref:histidine kinase n=1 Tax=Streptomyces radicis TaxID=1750517 RepID=A0A3A9WAB4_9ACTN|nr:histidine kinase [Streptomyces radicis]RKN10231.1 sensor histidine kinase [Streptomyces radicis]RKN24573.1 sensor histidine kinase [Streptomyces radicis]
MTLSARWERRLRRLRDANPYVVDTALAAFILVMACGQYVLPDDTKDGGGVTAWGFLLAAGTAVPLVWRRRAPEACSYVVSFCTPVMAIYHDPPPEVTYGGLVVLYTVAALTPPWHRRFMLSGWLGVSTLTLFALDADPLEYAFTLLSYVTAYAFGTLGRLQRAYTAAVEDRARRLERQRANEVAQAAARERARIARDMHDILAHAVSLMVVQAEAGPVVVRSDPARAEAAFDAIADTGRDAMAQLRRILGVLKDEQRGDLRTPQPTIAALPDLVAHVGRAGLRVSFTTEGAPTAVPPDTEVAAYRVVQEALTNTLKHARADSARVVLDWAGAAGELVITVTDDGRGPNDPDGADGSGGAGDPDGSRGHGLIGLRERASACGGTAEAGPAPGGGFRVVAHLPTAPVEVTA